MDGRPPAARGAAPRAALLFDLDGTLAQTEDLHHAAFNAILAGHGRTLDHATFKHHVSGRSNDDITAFLFPELGGDERGRLAATKEQRFRELAGEGVHATPGALALIDWARARGIATGLVTNAPRENAELMIDVLGLGGSFDVVVSAPDVARSKPHPDPYLAAIEALGVDPDRTVAVEDSHAGVAAALAAGLDVVAVVTSTTRASLEASGAVLAIADMTDPRLTAFIGRRCLGETVEPPRA